MSKQDNLSRRRANLSPAKQALLEKWTRGERKTKLSVIEQRKEQAPPPLTFAQQRLWFLNQLHPNSTSYNIPVGIRVTGRLNQAALEQSLNKIVQRHEVLRTTFAVIDSEPVQVIHSAPNSIISVVDLRNLPVIKRETEIKQLLIEAAQCPFDLGVGLLLRTTLLWLDEEEYILLIVMHHIVTDEWSMGVFIQELSTLYPAFCAGVSSPLPELPIQYGDFAVWQRQYLSESVLETQLNYWLSQLNSAPELLQLPTDRPRPSVQTYQGKTQSLTLNTDLTQKLQTLSQESGTTLFMTLLAVFATLLYRYSGQSDILVGTPIANRNPSEIESLIGFFVNTLVLRTRFEDNPSFEKLLTQVRETTLKAYEHQDVPFEQVVEALQPQRSLSHSPVFQVMFVLQNAPKGELELPGCTWCELNQQSTTAMFDLTVSMTETDQGLVGKWEYNTDLFDGSTIERMAAHFQNLCSAIVENPVAAVGELPLLSEAERHQLLLSFNDTASVYPTNKCIHQLFESQVERTPQSVAVVFENHQLSYVELNQRANQLAHHLLSLGVEPEVLVGICVERSVEMVVGLLGILKAGGAYVPLDPNYPQERLSYMLADSGVEVLLTQRSLLESLPSHTARVVCLDSDWGAIEQHQNDNLDVGVCSDNLAYTIYTSGSTGLPKGVQICHYSVVNFLNSMSYFPRLTQEDTFSAVTTICFDIAALEVYLPLIVGAKVIVVPREIATNGDLLFSELFKSKTTAMQATPATWQMLLAGGWSSDYPLKVFCGGEALPAQLAHQILETGSELWNLYGPTEATIWSTIYQVGANKTVARNEDAASSIGRPISNTQIYILDSYLQPVPVGVAGELYIGGDGLAKGYLNRPELTQEKFIPNHLCNSKSERLYKTGDRARYSSDGNIEYLGRIDQQVKVRGFRIELGEIEAVLNTHPQIQQAVVIAKADIPGNKRLVAYVVPCQELTTNQLREFLIQKLPEYMVPNTFVTLDTLPLTPNGKIDRFALPAPETVRDDLSKTFVAPQTPVEKILTEVWAQVLGIEQVGIHDNFFELGGDSITSIQIVARAKQMGLELTPRQMFARQTIAKLAEVTTTTQNIHLATGEIPLTPTQQCFFQQNLPNPARCDRTILLEVQQAIAPKLLAQVVQQLLSQHDALRLRFRNEESGWRQLLASSDDVLPITKLDFSTLAEVEQESAQKEALVQLQASLNLSDKPLIQFALCDLGKQKPQRIFIVIHSLIVDPAAWQILLEDFQTACNQVIRGKTIHLPPKTSSWQHWANRLHQYARSSTIQQELDYWLAESRRQVQPLPVDFSEGKTQVKNITKSSVALSAAQTQALLQKVPLAYQTQTDDVLLTALVQAFEQWTGESKLLVDLQCQGREKIFDDINVSRTVGCFTSTFPALLDATEASDSGETLKAIKEQLRLIPNKGIGYSILRYLCGDSTAIEMQALPSAEVRFYHQERFDRVLSQSSLLTAKQSTDLNPSIEEKHNYLLDISWSIIDNQLQLNWTYSKDIYRQSTIERLIETFMEALRSLISHCQLSETHYTPSDFPKANLSQKDLDRFLATFNRKSKNAL
ncbi:MAG: amino acid adenylation domain-containing protein [Nostoc sp. ChiSLP01]|nr:amino acid adenylation domain-containing protein [Nostoc sp. CmiSLP01]MDZ8284334.1 amino acid adenylation domain-containing protein [Nostoc sp. ChiSLP01]